MYTKQQLNNLSAIIGKAIKNYHDAIATNLRTLKTEVPVLGDDPDEEGITINVEYDGNLFPWTVDRIKWDEEHSSIMVHTSMNNYCKADDWTYLSNLGDATDYVLEAIHWPELVN